MDRPGLWGIQLSFSAASRYVYPLYIKRFLDVVISFVVLIILSPVLWATALAIKSDSPGSVLFKQKRVGLNGKIFTLYKFRSMFHNAEALREKLEHLNEMTAPVFKIKNDPRITGIGKVIRKFSIDELPQLLNVIRGDMSLVGIRPPLPEEVAAYDGWHFHRFCMKPGMTGIWQVSGRNEIDFVKWIKLDLYYIDSWSPALDFKLLIKTIPAVIFAKGAR